jgi:hypothetical protein
MKSWFLEMIRECLYFSSMRLEVPFIAPRQLGAVGGILGRQYLPSVGWCTGQSGAPPDIPCSLSGADRLPNLAQPTVEDLEPLAHRTLSGAPIRPLARSRVTRGLRGRSLARLNVGSPDSPVPPIRPLARPRVTRGLRGRPLAHRTVRCTIGQSGIF